ncbi:MAG: redox-active disulfide protein 2 [Spirosomataceae bacterium]
MKENSYSKMSTEQLKKTIGVSSAITGMLGVMLLILAGMAIYNKVQENNGSLSIAVPLALSPILFLNLVNIKNMKDELKKRENQ